VITEFLRASTEQEMREAFQACGVVKCVESGGAWQYKSTHAASIDIIGEIDGVPGFHANILCLSVTESQRSLLPFIQAPNTPERLFA
jgi:hypothetical protein